MIVLLKEQVLNELNVIQDRPVSTAMKIIRELPTIDLVRCGECIWGDTGIDEEGKFFWKCIGIHYGGTKPTDFCSYGERRADEYTDKRD